jgi:hypothetical protein
MPRPAAVLVGLALLASIGRVAAQPTFTKIVVADQVPLDLEPRDPALAAHGDVFVARLWLSPEARRRLAAGLGHRFLAAVDPEAPGPVILSTRELLPIPGDRRLRVELEDGTALQVLGVGAGIAESLDAARSEPMPRALLIGPDPGADPPEGWSRLGAPDARPSIWGRSVSVHGDSVEGSSRSIGIQDGFPFEHGADPRWRPWTDGLRSGIGPYPQHLQGIATDPDHRVYWSWTDRLVQTDADGRVLVEVEAPSHQGDLCWHDGRVVVAVNHGRFNDPEGRHDSWAFVYDTERLELLAKHRLPEVRYGAGGLCWAGDRYVVVGGLPEELRDDPDAANVVHEYDAEFRHLRTLHLGGGWTRLGIQTADFAYGRFFFGCYGEPRTTLVASADLSHVRRHDGIDMAYGVAAGPAGTLMLAIDERGEDGRHRGRIWWFGPGALRR